MRFSKVIKMVKTHEIILRGHDFSTEEYVYMWSDNFSFLPKHFCRNKTAFCWFAKVRVSHWMPLKAVCSNKDFLELSLTMSEWEGLS